MNAPQSFPDVGPSIGDILAALLHPAITDEDAMIYVGASLARSVTSALNADFEEVWCIMTHLPDGYLRLLESPEGWTALSAIVAADLGISPVPVIPVLH